MPAGWAGKAGGGGLGEGNQLAQGGIEGVLAELVAEPVQAGVGDVRPVDHGLGGGGVGKVAVGEIAANDGCRVVVPAWAASASWLSPR